MEKGNTKNYYAESQADYRKKCVQIALRFGVNEEDKRIGDAIEKYCEDNKIGKGGLARIAIIDKLVKDGYLTEWTTHAGTKKPIIYIV